MKYNHNSPNEIPPAFLKIFRTWVEAVVIKMRTKTTTKISDRGVTCMMVEYNVNLEADVYCMWNLTTNII